MSWLAILVLFVFVFALAPVFPYSRGWGPYPVGIGGLVLILFVLWMFFGGGIQRFR